ncbi:hypothetical protein [Aquabacterium sp.]|uniref:hypothetical protein n=1 Tax=Aquabacterium sp. TaxID=1872578 RepID=UPI0025C2ECAF|nr:hypothetical protein [Aquabacterium sp.]
MNCKPGQMAWIDFPRDERSLAMGLDQLQGHVVQVLALHPKSPQAAPVWIVEPPQAVVIRSDVLFRNGDVLYAGDVRPCEGIPDAFLRPLQDFDPEELRERHEELVS